MRAGRGAVCGTTRATNPRHSARRAWSHWAGGAWPVSGAPCVETRYSGPGRGIRRRRGGVGASRCCWLLSAPSGRYVRRAGRAVLPPGWRQHSYTTTSAAVAVAVPVFFADDAPRTRARTSAHHSFHAHTALHCRRRFAAPALSLGSLVPIGRHVGLSSSPSPFFLRSFGGHHYYYHHKTNIVRNKINIYIYIVRITYHYFALRSTVVCTSARTFIII